MQQPATHARRTAPVGTLLARAYLLLGMLEAAAAMAAFFFVLFAGGWQYGEMLAATDPLYLQATTACLAAIVMAQVVNVFACRHPACRSHVPASSNPFLCSACAPRSACCC